MTESERQSVNRVIEQLEASMKALADSKARQQATPVPHDRRKKERTCEPQATKQATQSSDTKV